MERFLEDYKTLDVFKDMKEQVKKGKFSHAHLFLSEDELSLSIISKLTALLILCENHNACFLCGDCIKILKETHPDFLCYPKEKKQLIVSESTKIVQDSFVKPMINESKIYLIYNIDKAESPAQNKILKILEEPPKNVYFLLTAKDTSKILPTIKSRTQLHVLKPFKKDALQAILKKNNIPCNDEILNFSEGWLGKALYYGGNKSFLDAEKFAFLILEKMKTSKDIIHFTGEFADKNTFALKLEILERIFRNILLIKYRKENILDEENDKLNVYANEFSEIASIKILEKIRNANKLFQNNVNLNLICDNLLLGILEVKYLWK